MNVPAEPYAVPPLTYLLSHANRANILKREDHAMFYITTPDGKIEISEITYECPICGNITV